MSSKISSATAFTTLSGAAFIDWLCAVWSPGLQTRHFTDAQRQVLHLYPPHTYIQLSTGGDPDLTDLLERVLRDPKTRSLVWCWRAGGYVVLRVPTS